jgi:FixJ family two-component response regulator
VSSHPVPRIFVVDDEHVIVATLAIIVNMHGFSARFFTDPVEALTARSIGYPRCTGIRRRDAGHFRD